MNNKPDPLQQAKQRELLEKLLLAYGCEKNLDGLDNSELKKMLEQVVCGGLAS